VLLLTLEQVLKHYKQKKVWQNTNCNSAGVLSMPNRSLVFEQYACCAASQLASVLAVFQNIQTM
jgi:hypothetical protein